MATLSQDDFRQLLSTKQNDSESHGKKKTNTKKNNAYSSRKQQMVEKKEVFVPSRVYRDRAAERRDGMQDDEQEPVGLLKTKTNPTFVTSIESASASSLGPKVASLGPTASSLGSKVAASAPAVDMTFLATLKDQKQQLLQASESMLKHEQERKDLEKRTQGQDKERRGRNARIRAWLTAQKEESEKDQKSTKNVEQMVYQFKMNMHEVNEVPIILTRRPEEMVKEDVVLGHPGEYLLQHVHRLRNDKAAQSRRRQERKVAQEAQERREEEASRVIAEPELDMFGDCVAAGGDAPKPSEKQPSSSLASREKTFRNSYFDNLSATTAIAAQLEDEQNRELQVERDAEISLRKAQEVEFKRVETEKRLRKKMIENSDQSGYDECYPGFEVSIGNRGDDSEEEDGPVTVTIQDPTTEIKSKKRKAAKHDRRLDSDLKKISKIMEEKTKASL